MASPPIRGSSFRLPQKSRSFSNVIPRNSAVTRASIAHFIGENNFIHSITRLGVSSVFTPLGLITPTTIKMTRTGTPNAIAVSAVDAMLPIANPRETEDMVIKQYVFINVPIDDRNPVNFLSTDANIKAKLASSGISANTFASRYSRLEYDERICSRNTTPRSFANRSNVFISAMMLKLIHPYVNKATLSAILFVKDLSCRTDLNIDANNLA
mmetsp:Transcript_26050/g.40532  ORF Transcript_26050/g.40532 Transcript_26050/m.40532 type:complete len:212 (-) Transcript_26050:78-713(-)